MIPYIRALALIYSQRVPEILETLIGFDPKTEKESESRKKNETRLSVNRSCPRSTSPVNRDQQRSGSCQSVDREVDRSLPRSIGRSTGPCLCTSCTPVDCAVYRAPPPVDRMVDRALSRPASMSFSLSLTSDLCAISSISFISSLPTNC